MPDLNGDQFKAMLRPKAKDGSDLYPQPAPDYDSMPFHRLSDPDELPKLLRQRKAFKYDENEGFVPEKVHEWELDHKGGTTKIPAGYKMTKDGNPLRW